ncbi:MAG TPA: ABC transporter permease [Chryseolinea sp.]|nr:ABC transporter permease [Chryseolinea sp.]
MLRNYLNVAFRNLLRNKSASLIKITSLSVGMICFAIISLFVYNELSYDRFHTDPQQVFRVVKDFIDDDGSRLPDATTPPAFGPAIQKEIPEVAYSTRIFPNWGRKYLIQHQDKRTYEEGVVRIDSSFFDVFTFPFVKGDKKTATSNPNFIILTESTARRIFKNEDPIGKPLKIDIGQNGTDYFVSGIVTDVPENSHFTFDFLVSIRSFQNRQLDSDWGFYNFYTYVRLHPEADADAFKNKIQPLFKKHNPDQKTECYVQALTDIHLKSNLKWELSTNGDYSYLRILSIIAIATILLAAINYINLVTAQSARRAKEVGVRKVSGGTRNALIVQFLCESVIIASVSTIVSVAIVESILPGISGLFSATLSFFTPAGKDVLWMVLGVGVTTGLIAGLYPAFYLSSFQPVHALKGTSIFGGGSFLRKGLVTFQFIISTVLIIGTIVISSQIDFVQNKKLGFSKENIMLIHNAGELKNRTSLITEIKKSTGVMNAGGANGVIGGQNWTTGAQAKGQENGLLLNLLVTDYDFLDVMDVAFKDGRNFSRDTQADSSAIILNETAVKQLGIKGDVIGSRINVFDTVYTVIGTIEDFHFTSFHEPIKPFGFFLVEAGINKLFVKIDKEKTTESIEKIRELWSTLVPDRPFEFTFQDEQVAKLYASELKFQKLFSIFTFIAILIACLGLFGLSAYTSQQRTKEIGVRKVLGASVMGVTGLLSKEFLKLVFVAVGVSIPVAWYAMREWLANFAYHVDLKAWMFVVSGLTAVGIALITVCFQSIKAAMANPVKSLRNE